MSRGDSGKRTDRRGAGLALVIRLLLVLVLLQSQVVYTLWRYATILDAAGLTVESTAGWADGLPAPAAGKPD